MSLQKLNVILVRHLQNINRTRETINKTTIYKDILTTNDGMGGLSSSDLYQLLVQNHIKSLNKPQKVWPRNWLDLTVEDLSLYISSN